jgi:hypothetical protein
MVAVWQIVVPVSSDDATCDDDVRYGVCNGGGGCVRLLEAVHASWCLRRLARGVWMHD